MRLTRLTALERFTGMVRVGGYSWRRTFDLPGAAAFLSISTSTTGRNTPMRGCSTPSTCCWGNNGQSQVLILQRAESRLTPVLATQRRSDPTTALDACAHLT